MANRTRADKNEYQFKIDAYTPETMPLARLAEYLRDIATLFGEVDRVHLIKLLKGSTTSVIRVEPEADPKVRERLSGVRRNDAPAEILRAAMQIEERLQRDNARAVVIDPGGARIYKFRGRDVLAQLEYGPFNQPDSFDGIPIRLGGEQQVVPVHLEGPTGEAFIGSATRDLAKRIAPHLFTSVIRVNGTGRWKRNTEGEWERLNFTIRDFEPLSSDESLERFMDRLRSIPARWKDQEDPLKELDQIRHGPVN